MNISVKGQYALQALFDLSLQQPHTPIKIAEIASRQQIPQKFLELILATLKQGGYVESRRGAEGGYLLARPADSITVGEVIRFLEGGKGRPGKGDGDSPFTDLWDRVEVAVSQVLDHTTFADLVNAWRDKQSVYIPHWDI